MTDRLLITSADVAKIALIAPTQNFSAILDPCIRAAQDFEIKTRLGDAMYRDLINNYSAQKYVDLLDGKDYTNLADEAVTFRGLKWAIAYFARSRYLMEKTSTDTPAGMKQKISEFSESTSYKQVKAKADQAMLDGSKYLDDCIKFIESNLTTYTLFDSDCGERSFSTNYKMRTI